MLLVPATLKGKIQYRYYDIPKHVMLSLLLFFIDLSAHPDKPVKFAWANKNKTFFLN